MGTRIRDCLYFQKHSTNALNVLQKQKHKTKKSKINVNFADLTSMTRVVNLSHQSYSVRTDQSVLHQF